MECTPNWKKDKGSPERGTDARRRFSREVKLAAAERMLAGENVAALTRELGWRAHKLLYHWRASI
ncbi:MULTISPECIES: transposase [unclassified Mesorhizobium]|uniref:transposase n=1 Tax=unclassified Mesorhizobium TaxID=325217 RepID=UPI001CCA077A|nr:transposase [Mesorhizobium sp. CA5]MBZ9861992.1 transposase [Mesorhizobium sp. CA12]